MTGRLGCSQELSWLAAVLTEKAGKFVLCKFSVHKIGGEEVVDLGCQFLPVSYIKLLLGTVFISSVCGVSCFPDNSMCMQKVILVFFDIFIGCFLVQVSVEGKW